MCFFGTLYYVMIFPLIVFISWIGLSQLASYFLKSSMHFCTVCAPISNRRGCSTWYFYQNFLSSTLWQSEIMKWIWLLEIIETRFTCHYFLTMGRGPSTEWRKGRDTFLHFHLFCNPSVPVWELVFHNPPPLPTTIYLYLCSNTHSACLYPPPHKTYLQVQSEIRI